jgi:hypothetical protein
MEREDLRRTLRARRDKLAIWITEVAAERERLIRKGHIDAVAASVMRRAIVHVEAEIRWHDEIDAELAGTGTEAGVAAGGAVAETPAGDQTPGGGNA